MPERLAAEGGRPVRETFLVFGAPQILEDEIREVVDTLRSGWIGTGPKVRRFERMFAEYIGAKHAVALSSCTAGLELALEVLGIGPGDEVITTPLTFSATANVIVHRGARPVFADIELPSMNIDPNEIERRITPKTKAIIPVHFAGRPCRMDDIMDIARRHGLFVIEDAAHAIEAWYRGRKIGTIGDMTCFSFYATKNLTTAEGGMVTTENDEWAEEIRI
ncbi:UDP-4-amino-4,6-dideoxy-N-acetyl-beta-L-altrosamine transaminase, partial [Candidatus Poribacteria bacterium]